MNHGSLLKATIPAGKSFRLTGITFKNSPNLTTTGGDGAIRVGSTGGLVTNARIDHCHFYHLAWDAMLQVSGWTYGVDDHNLFEQGTASIIRTLLLTVQRMVTLTATVRGPIFPITGPTNFGS